MTGSWAMEESALWVTTAQEGWAVSTPSSVQTEPTVTRRACPSVSPVLKVRTSRQIVHFQFMKIHYTRNFMQKFYAVTVALHRITYDMREFY